MCLKIRYRFISWRFMVWFYCVKLYVEQGKLLIEWLVFNTNNANTVLKYADFYNWNRIKVRYCDGSSFTGDVERVDPVSCCIFCLLWTNNFLFSKSIKMLVITPWNLELQWSYGFTCESYQANNLHFRGARVWLAIIEDLKAKGMSKAEHVCQSL